MSNKLVHKNNSNSYPKNQSIQVSNRLLMIPLIFIISILPFITRLHEYNPNLSMFSWFPSNNKQYDIFLYYKQIFLIIVCTIMTLIIGFYLYKKKKDIKFIPAFIILLAYSTLTLISTIFSKYRSFGFTGIFEQFESVFVLLGYCIIVYYAFVFVNTEDDVKLIFKYLIISIFVLSLLGITQILGHDFFSTDFGLKLILPNLFWDQLDNVNFSFGPNRVYLTLYNPNYVGVYVALIIPILLCLILIAKNLKRLIIYIIAAIGLLISLYGSKSDAGFIGITVSLVFIIILFRRYIISKIKFLLPIGIILLLLIVYLKDLSYIKSIANQLIPQKVKYNLTDIKTDDNIIITYKGNLLYVSYTGTAENGITITTKDDRDSDVPFKINSTNGSFDIDDERFSGFNMSPVIYNNMLCLNIKIDGKGWLFTNQLNDGTYYYINSYGKPDKIISADSSLFTGYESFASHRGYIWSRTIPLMKNYLLFGSGADTFSLVFPQQDYVNLSNAGYSGALLTKPHNMYLQTGVQTGVLSLIALLIFYGMYFIKSMYLYLNGRFDNIFSQVGVAIFIGSISYIVVGITNDSSVTVAPVFWALIGVGIACNYKVQNIHATE